MLPKKGENVSRLTALTPHEASGCDRREGKKRKKNHIEFFIFSGKLFFSGDAPKKNVNDRLRV